MREDRTGALWGQEGPKLKYINAFLKLCSRCWTIAINGDGSIDVLNLATHRTEADLSSNNNEVKTTLPSSASERRGFASSPLPSTLNVMLTQVDEEWAPATIRSLPRQRPETCRQRLGTGFS